MRYLTFTQLRTKLGGRARSSIYLDVDAGRLPSPFKLGGRLYWCEGDVDERLQSSAAAQAVDKNGDAVSGVATDKPGPVRHNGRRLSRNRPSLHANEGPDCVRLFSSDGEGTE